MGLINSVFQDLKIDVVAIDAAADDEDVTSLAVDMQDYEGVAFIATAQKGGVAAFTMHAEQDVAANMATAADLEGTSIAFSTAVATDGVGVLDIKRPQERYVRAVLTCPNTAGLAVSIIAIRYNGGIVPVTNVGEFHVSPAEGVA
jgi:hypothetical protein